jgi:RimJ/RimL family protein N-acetyltransferase
MTEDLRFSRGSAYSLDALAEIFTRSFEGYFYPQQATGALLAARARIENLDLHRTLVIESGGEPVGIAVLGLRGERAWCGGFGVAARARGRGLSHRLVAAMLEQAREAGARECALEVLTRNQRAIAAYARAGFRVTRDLRIVEWRQPETEARRRETGEQAGAAVLVEHAPALLLERFAVLHPAPAAWQRDLPSLLVRAKVIGLAIMAGGRAAAYALVSETADGGAHLQDLGAENDGLASALLAALQRRYARIVSVNEPADSPLTAAFDLAGFAETDRQHEMVIEL